MLTHPQLVEAGWYYDPTLDTPDGATCAYCSLSLDAWDVGDDPMEEHRRRAPDCLFFALKELYHPPAPVLATKKGKRASTRTSTASTASKTRGKKRTSEQIDDTISSVSEKPTRGKKRASTLIDDTLDHVVEKHTRGKQRASEQIDDTLDNAKPKTTRGKKPAGEQLDDTLDHVVEKPTRSRKRASEQIDDTLESVKPKATRGKKRASQQVDNTAAEVFAKPLRGKQPAEDQPDTSMDYATAEPAPALAPKPKARKAAPKAKRASTASTATKSRSKKRTSDQMDDTDVVEASPKRIRYSSISSLPDSLPVGTPKRTPAKLAEAEPVEEESVEAEIEDLEADISSLPASLLVGTPKKTPPRRMTPEHVHQTETWDPIDMDAFLGNTGDLHAFMNDVVIDAGLDAIVAAGANAKDLQADVLGGLTQSEKEMTVEQWVLYNAKRGEEKLRQACGKQILAFEAEALRARAAIEGLPTC